MCFLQDRRYRRIFALCLIAFLSKDLVSLAAQSLVTAPVPATIASAKTVFVGNAGAEANNISERGYSILYSALATWNRYQVVSEPASADLLLELYYFSPVGATKVFKGETLGSPQFLPRFQLVIIDRSTHAILWSVTEFPFGTRKQKFEETNDNAVNALIGDLKSLSAGQMPSAAPATLRK